MPFLLVKQVMKAAYSYRRDVLLDSADVPIVIIGTGPVGMRTAYELLKRDPCSTIYLYGGEPWAPYDRVALSSVLSGSTGWSAIDSELHVPLSAHVLRFDNCPVIRIARDENKIIDCQHREQYYSKLVLATGSRPHVPVIPGIDLPGVYTFRNRDDVQKLMARRTRSRSTVVLGGGVLGIEAARAMQQQNTEVTLIEHGPRLMGGQLDEAAASIVREHLLHLGINVILSSGVKHIIGDNAVNGLQLQNGRIIHCDTVVLSAGIRPNIDLARDAGLSIGRGVRVDDQMRTSDPVIYAVGECAEHRDKIYGLVAPGIEQSAVAAHSISGGTSTYAGSVVSTSLKVVDIPVFSAGNPDTEQDRPALLKDVVYEDPSHRVYKKLVMQNGRLVGAIGIGDSSDNARTLEKIRNKSRLWPWQVRLFRRTGSLWHTDESVAAWPSASIVCNCKGVSRGQLSDRIDAGCRSVEQLASSTGASSVCGSCKPLIANLLGEILIEKPGRLTTPMFIVSVTAILMAIIVAILPAIPLSTSASLQGDYDILWRNGLLRQVTGFTLLGLSILLLLLPLRKRWKRFEFGSFINWRFAHGVIGVFLIIAMIAHTGMRLGENLNTLLVSTYIASMLIGGFAGMSTHSESYLRARYAKSLRLIANRLHIYMLWPAPALLTAHILTVYYF